MNIIFSALLALFMSLTVTPTDPQLAALLDEMQQDATEQGQTVDFDGQQIILSVNVPAPLAEAQSMAAMIAPQLKQQMAASMQPEEKSRLKDVMSANNCTLLIQMVGSDGATVATTITPDEL